MSLGSSCYAIISPEKAFGKIGVPPKVPPNSELFLQLEIIDIESSFVPRFLAVPPERTKCISNEYIFQEAVSFSESAKIKKNLSEEGLLYIEVPNGINIHRSASDPTLGCLHYYFYDEETFKYIQRP